MGNSKLYNIDICDKIGRTIKEIRNERGLSQEEFSELIQVHRTYISPLENGKKNPSIKTLKKILTILDLSLEEFFRRVEL